MPLLLAITLGLSACGNEPQTSQTEENTETTNTAAKNISPTEIQETENNNSIENNNNEANTPSYTLAQIGEHASKEDCWFAIKEKVYDVSAFIASGQHNPIISQGCGKDATSLFISRPGKGTDHPETAYSMLGQYYIGELSQ